MSTWFVSRHRGAVEWAAQQGLLIDHAVAHLDLAALREGDIVIGTLPVNLVADVCDRGARYLHLSLRLPAEARGRELSAEELRNFDARLEEYQVCRRPEPLDILGRTR